MEEDLANLNISEEEKAPSQGQGHVDVIEEDYRLFFDLKKVSEGMSWTFNRHLIIFHKLEQGEDLLEVPLNYSIFWAQIHNLPMGLMSKGMACQFGNFIGTFMEYDTALISRGIGRFMRIRVKVDVRIPLKRIVLGQNCSVFAYFQYEKLTLFYFLCGKLGHGEGFYLMRVTFGTQVVEFRWDISLKKASRMG
ncbi:hypothetical protein PVK06_035948 [Gossypium arboreum]|uniref:Zinc knuckle CX2CX4HX4C domain-containing protein n=1 Tax=Gossypium arboreum TaxID=29729 RepID=A0ABR0NI50_GOSAR|nr:hypothetical protein PVK06_035948 [Gossypium arboreum]